MRDRMKIMLPVFVRNYNCNYNEIYTNHGCFLYKVQIIFPLILLHYQHSFFYLCVSCYMQVMKIVCWSAAGLATNVLSTNVKMTVPGSNRTNINGLAVLQAAVKYLQPSVTWIVSVIQFYLYNILGLQNLIWQLYQQRKCLKTLTYHF
jgi:hypothetical protein